MAAFDGTWEYVGEENLANYLKALGVTDEVSKYFMDSEHNTLAITHTGTEWTLTFNMDGEKFKETYTEGVEKTTRALNSKNIKVTLKLESETQMVELFNDPDYTMKTTREVTGDELTETMCVNGITAVEKYKRI